MHWESNRAAMLISICGLWWGLVPGSECSLGQSPQAANVELPLAEAVDNRSLWPRVINITKPVRLQKPDGSLLEAGAGTPCEVRSASAEGVDVVIDGAAYRVPYERTDFLMLATQRATRARAAVEAEQDGVGDTASLAPPAKSEGWASETDFATSLNQAMMRLQNGTLRAATDLVLQPGKDILLFIGSANSASSAKFLQRLIKFEQASAEVRGSFVLVYAGHDTSREKTAAFLAATGSSWAAVDPLSKLNREVLAFGGRDVPCLILMTAEGKILKHSTSAEGYFDPDSVINALLVRMELRRQGMPVD